MVRRYLRLMWQAGTWRLLEPSDGHSVGDLQVRFPACRVSDGVCLLLMEWQTVSGDLLPDYHLFTTPGPDRDSILEVEMFWGERSAALNRSEKDGLLVSSVWGGGSADGDRSLIGLEITGADGPPDRVWMSWPASGVRDLTVELPTP